MKKSNIALILVILVLGIYFGYDSQGGRSFFNSLFSEDLEILRQTSLAFIEDIKFKDFDKAATYHHPDDQKKVNIPNLIENLFKIKPEFLDIMEYKILESSLDSSQKRGRVKLKTKVNILNSDEIKNLELLLYFHKRNAKWYMELESSLK